MSVKRAAWAVITFLLLGLVGSLGVKTMAEKTKGNSELPLKTISVTFDVSERESFFDQMRKFADKHGFASRVAPVNPNGEHFIVEMWRSDYKIIALNSFDPGTFKIRVYENDANGVPQDYLDSLVVDLKSFVAAVPAAKVTE